MLIWAYTGRVHGTLYELGSEHGDLRKHDVKLEFQDTPAADKWQRMKQIAIIVEPAYRDPRVGRVRQGPVEDPPGEPRHRRAAAQRLPGPRRAASGPARHGAPCREAVEPGRERRVRWW